MIDSLEIAIGVIVSLLFFLKSKVYSMNLLQEGRNASFEYGHYGNPTTKALEEKMRYLIFYTLSCCMWSFGCTFYCCSLMQFLCWSSALEKAESTLFVSSGMYASVGMLTALVPVARHIITTTDCYRKTRIFIQNELPKMGISVILYLL